jgi:hypothetical protein
MLKEGIGVEYLDSLHLTVKDLASGTLFLRAITVPQLRKDDLTSEVTGYSSAARSHGASDAAL